MTAERNVGILALLLASGLLAACETAPVEGSAPPAASAMERHAALPPLWGDNVRSVYALEMASGLELSGTKTLAFTLISDLSLDAKHEDGDRVRVVATLASPKFSGADPATRDAFAKLAEELRAPFVFVLERGKLVELRASPANTTFATSICRTLAASLQVAQGTGDRWSAKEDDASGTYEAEYQRIGAGELSKRKVSYDGITAGKASLGALNANIALEVKASKGKILFAQGQGGSSRIEQLELHDEVLTRFATTEVSSKTDVKLVVKGPPSAATVAFAELVAATQVIDPKTAQRAPRMDYDALRIGNYTFETALAELEKQAKDPKRNEISGSVLGQQQQPDVVAERQARLESQNKVFTAMSAILRTQPRHIPAALAQVRKKADAGSELIDALSSAGTPAAQDALIELADDPKLGDTTRRSAAFALSRTTAATPNAVSALERYLRVPALRVHALYALGTICRRLREEGAKDRADRIVETLLAALKEAKTPAEQVDALRSIANSGHPGAFEPVKPYFTASNAKVRVAAVDAIRLMPGAEADTVIAKSLTDGPAEVQVAAIEAVAVREPSNTLASALTAAGNAIEKVATRLKLVQVIERWLEQRPELLTELQRLSTSDPAPVVQEAAKAALARRQPAKK
ncbi:MAG TPA: hypothetical protein VGK73_06900 [Polyangiaceae bacterium]